MFLTVYLLALTIFSLSVDQIVVNDLKLGTTHTFACDCELSGYDNTKILPPV